jgi:hypothetical protein
MKSSNFKKFLEKAKLSIKQDKYLDGKLKKAAEKLNSPTVVAVAKTNDVLVETSNN